MRAVRLTFLEPRVLEWREVPDATSEQPALVQPVAVATCDLDTAFVNGAAPVAGPFAFGHEFIADVVEIGDGVASVGIGDRVVVPFQIGCGACGRCRAGLTGSCEAVPFLSAYGLAPLSRTEWGGALSDLVRVPFADAMCVPLPPGLDPVTVASIGDNIPDGYRAVGPALAAHPGAPVLVLGGAGAGSVGLYAAGIAAALGASRIDYVDTDDDRLAVAEKLGAQPLERPPDDSTRAYPIVVHHTGSRAQLVDALHAVEAGGVCVSTGIIFEPETPIPLFEMYSTGVTLTTGRVDARATIPAVLEVLATTDFRPELVTHTTASWGDAAEVLAAHTHKTVVVRDA